jgi:hypothetical protein
VFESWIFKLFPFYFFIKLFYGFSENAPVEQRMESPDQQPETELER